MAELRLLTFHSGDYPRTSFYEVSGTITEEDVKRINGTTFPCVLVMKYTKDQNPNILRKIHNPHIRLSVSGGIDYLHKKKHQSRHYIDRTIYPPNVLASIIEEFEKIEKQMRYSWTPLQKAMFVYKTLTEQMHYKYDNENIHENGRMVVSSLEGLLYKRAYCAGFSLIFKEMMDRLDIPCLYQDRQHHHCWNILRIDGKNYGIELTWECDHKNKDNKCQFGYFGLDSNFYQNKHHNLSNEPEENMVPLSTFDRNVIEENYKNIAYENNVEKRSMSLIPDSAGMLYYYPMEMKNGNYVYMIYDHKNSFIIYTNKKQEELTTKNVVECLHNGGYHPSLSNREKGFQEYVRDDKSQFFIAPSKHKLSDIDEYYYYDIQDTPNGPVLRRGVLLSETNLFHTHDSYAKRVIANNLLSEERLRKKLDHYHGYVGFIRYNNLHYRKNFEQEKLHIREHI